MADVIFGSVDSRELHLRYFAPLTFQVWDQGGFRIAPLRLLNPLRWWRTATVRDNWRLELRRHVDANHRCYCQSGTSIDGAVVICGFGLLFWYSNFTDDVPCPCDIAMERLREESEVG